MNFQSFDFHSSIVANIKHMGYETPTPIQAESMPSVLEGKDVMGLAQTGTGKTAAFLLPMIDRFLKNPIRTKGLIRALVIAPTRELAEQINEAARDLSNGTRFRTITVYGGMAMSPQTYKLRQGAELVVACPGRLLDHLNHGNVDLSQVEMLVLDEADHMFDMGFLPDIQKILDRLPKERQTLMFSATMPDSIRSLAREVLTDPITVKVGNSTPAMTIAQTIYPVLSDEKPNLLLELLNKCAEGSVLIFTRTKHRAKRLAEHLEKNGHKASSLQGNMSQNQRQRTMDGFRLGRFRMLVATDIAARGIDVSRVAHVINFDLPDTPETYTHRVGRTGRAERTGEAHSLVCGEDASMVRAIERLLGKPLERVNMEGFEVPNMDWNAPRPVAPWQQRGRYQGGRPGGHQQPHRTGGYGRPGGATRHEGRSYAGSDAPRRDDRAQAAGGERNYNNDRTPGGYATERSKGNYGGERARSNYSSDRGPASGERGRQGNDRSQGNYGGERNFNNDRAPGGYATERARSNYSSDRAPAGGGERNYNNDRTPGGYATERARNTNSGDRPAQRKWTGSRDGSYSGR